MERNADLTTRNTPEPGFADDRALIAALGVLIGRGVPGRFAWCGLASGSILGWVFVGTLGIVGITIGVVVGGRDVVADAGEG